MITHILLHIINGTGYFPKINEFYQNNLIGTNCSLPPKAGIIPLLVMKTYIIVTN